MNAVKENINRSFFQNATSKHSTGQCLLFQKFIVFLLRKDKDMLLRILYYIEKNATILAIIFWDFLMFYQIFVSAQVKWIVIISNKHGIYELPHELPNDLRLRILGNQEILRTSQIFTELQPSAQSSYQNENFVNTSKKLFKNWNWTFPVVCYFTLTLKLVSYILARIEGKVSNC